MYLAVLRFPVYRLSVELLKGSRPASIELLKLRPWNPPLMACVDMGILNCGDLSNMSIVPIEPF